MPTRIGAQEVGLVDLDVKDVAKGYRAETLKLKTVTNEKGEAIGKIEDFIFSRDGGQVFVVLTVGDLGALAAVPFEKLQLADHSGKVVLPGANREALAKLPVFFYESRP
jgi:sporulation protein YlmC with PRC-barrel domain